MNSNCIPDVWKMTGKGFFKYRRFTVSKLEGLKERLRTETDRNIARWWLYVVLLSEWYYSAYVEDSESQTAGGNQASGIKRHVVKDEHKHKHKCRSGCVPFERPEWKEENSN
jgi:hypothetical protein